MTTCESCVLYRRSGCSAAWQPDGTAPGWPRVPASARRCVAYRPRVPGWARHDTPLEGIAHLQQYVQPRCHAVIVLLADGGALTRPLNYCVSVVETPPEHGTMAFVAGDELRCGISAEQLLADIMESVLNSAQ